MNLQSLTKEQAHQILAWTRTDAGELFNEYLISQNDPAIADLTSAANMRDVFRAQGKLEMLERVFQFFSFVSEVARGNDESEGSVGPGSDLPNLPPPWGPPVDHGSGVGSEDGS